MKVGLSGLNIQPLAKALDAETNKNTQTSSATQAAQTTPTKLLDAFDAPLANSLSNAFSIENRVLANSAPFSPKNRLMNSPGFQRLNPEQQKLALEALKTDPFSVTSIINLLNSKGFQSLSSNQKTQALVVCKAADAKGRAELVKLAYREINGKTALLNKDKDGNTLIRSLHLLATQPLHADFAKEKVSRKDLLYGVMQEAADPYQVNQGSHGTCTVTAMQYMLCKQNPAEYVRIMQGITSTSGKTKLRDGSTLRLSPECIKPDDNIFRSTSERIFQASMMDFSNGSLSYNNADDSQPKGKSGLNKDEQKKGLEALFGKKFKHKDGKGFLGLWTNKTAVVNELEKRGKKGQETYVRMHWGDGKKDGHAVVVYKVENGRVYFRNPWGEQSEKEDGKIYNNPPRRMEDKAKGLESMSISDFKKWFKGCFIPS